MEYNFLGRTGLHVSKICLGTFNFGRLTNEKDAHRIMDRAVDKGVNFFDTANHYPDFVNCGRTESIIGSWIKNNKSKRDKIIIGSKVTEINQLPVVNRFDERSSRTEYLPTQIKHGQLSTFR